MRAIIARAESFTLEGDCPSAQLTVESAVAFDAAVVDHRFKPEAIYSCLKMKNRPGGRLGIDRDRSAFAVAKAAQGSEIDSVGR